MMQNNRQKVIIITGSIGTGKSTAVNIIKNMGFKVLDSDKIVHEGYVVGNELYWHVLNCFGKSILNDDGTINRTKLSKIVFNNERDLKKLNEVVHSTVVSELMKSVENCHDKVIFLDIPLILEEKENLIHFGLRYDEIWLVYVNAKIQRERLIRRAKNENKSPEDVLNIINKQISIEKKKSMVDKILVNEGTINDLERQIKELLKSIGLDSDR